MNTPRLKGYLQWLNENFEIQEAEAASAMDANTLFKMNDRDGMVNLATSSDPEQVKSIPVYQPIMDWWKRGGGDIGIVKNVLKSGANVKGDDTLSLKSAYYWAGANSTKGSAIKTDLALKVGDAIVANAQKIGLDVTKTDQLKQALNILRTNQQKGIVLSNEGFLSSIIPSKLRSNGFMSDGVQLNVIAELSKPVINTNLTNAITNWQFSGDDPALRTDPLTSVNWLMQKQSEPNSGYWTAATKLTEQDKIDLLNIFTTRATAYVAKKNNPNFTVDQAIATATNLYIAPRNETVTVKPATGQVNPPSTVIFSYPGNPNGDPNSEAFKKGLKLFPDDGATLTPEAIAEINSGVKQIIDSIKSTGGTINNVKTWGVSSTSKVGTTYGSTTGVSSPENNIKLANDRLAAINAAFSNAIKLNGVNVPTTIVTTMNIARPNQGPEWTDAQKKDPKFGPVGNRSVIYEQTYGPNRYAIGFCQLEVTTQPNAQTQISSQATATGQWKAFISWFDESIKIKIPQIRMITSYVATPKVAVGSCPSF